MNYLDEKYSSAGNTNIYNDGSKNININSSRSRAKSNQDEIFNHRQCNVDHNENMIMKNQGDYNTNNNDRAKKKILYLLQNRIFKTHVRNQAWIYNKCLKYLQNPRRQQCLPKLK